MRRAYLRLDVVTLPRAGQYPAPLSAEQPLQLLRRVRVRHGGVDDEAVLGALLRHEDSVLEDELSHLGMLEYLAAHAARRHLVQLPPLAELGARLLKG